MRLERIIHEIHKKEALITDLQNDLKTLRAMKAQCEDTELLKVLHTMKLSKEELLRFVQEKKQAAEQPQYQTNTKEETYDENDDDETIA